MITGPVWCLILIMIFSNTTNASCSHLEEIPSIPPYHPVLTSTKPEFPQQKIQDNLEGSFGSIIKNLDINHEVRSLDFSPSGRYLTVGGLSHWEGGSLSLWDLSLGRIECKWFIENAWQNNRHFQGTEARRYETSQEAIAFSPDEKTLASAGWMGYLHLWNISDGRQIITFKESLVHKFQHLLFTPDGTEIIASTKDGYLTF